MIHMTFQHMLSYGLLSCAIIALWFPRIELKRFSVHPWQILCIAGLGCGMAFGHIQPTGLLLLTIVGISSYVTGSEQYGKYARIIGGVIMFALSVALSQHVAPGFSNPKIIDNIIVSEGGIPYSIYLNFDKTFVGILVLGFIFNNLLSKPKYFWVIFKKAVPISVITIFVLLFTSFAFGYVRFDPKWPTFVFFWVWTNLFLVCTVEEAIYRGIMQRYIVVGMEKYRYGAFVGIVSAAVLFGLMHYSGGRKYILLSTIAGLGYGWAYFRTRQIEASVLTHFLLNFIHFTLFTYPALATAVT